MRLFYHANDRTDFGVGYTYRINKPETSLKLGFQHVLSDGVTLKGRIDQNGHIDYAVKAQISKDFWVLASTGVESTILKGKSDTTFGLAFETKI